MDPVPVGRTGTAAPRRLRGTPLTLLGYPAEGRVNPQFLGIVPESFARVYVPPGLAPLLRESPVERGEFLEDDNRGAVRPDPIATLDGVPYYLSVKGVGSAFDPFADRPLDLATVLELTEDAETRRRLSAAPTGAPARFITGELWLRGSPYGGQGLGHASQALSVSERADLTNLNGFRIAPVVRISYLPPELEAAVRGIHWYRRFPDRIVQELRLVPSNVRIYFHARTTVGADAAGVFDQFGVDTAARAYGFEVNFMRSALAMLTLFARSLRRGPAPEEFRGLDYHDVWLDKDAVLAPDGTVHFVDLEGIEEVTVGRAAVREKIEDQIYRSLYEGMFAYEQLEAERSRRFGPGGPRKGRFESLLERALATDPFLRLRRAPGRLELEVRNALSERELYLTFPILDL